MADVEEDCRHPRTGVPPLVVSRQSLVVILNYALTAEQPDPCGPEPYSPGKWPRTRSLLGEGPVTPRVPEEVALSQNSWGPGPPGPGPPYTIRTPQQGGTDTPPGAGPKPFSPGQRPQTHSLLGKGPVTPRVPEKGALCQNSRGPRTSYRAPDPHILSGPLSGEGTNSPPGAGP